MADILVIEDNDTMREGLTAALEEFGHRVWAADSGPEGLALYQSRPIDLVISDLKMEPMTGFEALDALRAQDPQALVVIITAFGEIDTAVEAMKRGAVDFLTKPFEVDVLEVKVTKALERARLQQDRDRLESENVYLREEESRRFDLSGLVAGEGPMQEVLARLGKIARTDSTVMILGESGTGKELTARALHQRSSRAGRPFIKVHCGALADGVLESELFGHEKGAFTGAMRRKIGRFEMADGGTLFLDEVGDLSPLIQQKLLRVLQEREFERVGGERTIRVNIRLITATHRDMEREVAQGRFRQDLYYRLHVVPVRLPALRDRTRDIPALARHFLEKLRARTRSTVHEFAPETLAMLCTARWPGNVRQLENVIENALVFAEGERLEKHHLPAWLQSESAPIGGAVSAADDGRPLTDRMESYERELILSAVAASDGTKTDVARRLGIKTSALYYKLEKYGLKIGGAADDEGERTATEG